MPYRNPFPTRIAMQMQSHVDTYAGQVVTWRQYVSASAGGGAAWAGISNSAYYQENLITAHVTNVELNEEQRAAGQAIADMLQMVMPIQPGTKDELVWRGNVYRVEGEPVPASIDSRYIVTVKRGNT